MSKNDKICGTCKYVETQRTKDGKLPSLGYCYGMPPMWPGQFRPTVGLKNISCHIYEERYE